MSTQGWVSWNVATSHPFSTPKNTIWSTPRCCGGGNRGDCEFMTTPHPLSPKMRMVQSQCTCKVKSGTFRCDEIGALIVILSVHMVKTQIQYILKFCKYHSIKFTHLKLQLTFKSCSLHKSLHTWLNFLY